MIQLSCQNNKEPYYNISQVFFKDKNMGIETGKKITMYIRVINNLCYVKHIF